jgi:NADH-quinone oxidoreductase subunit A
MAVDYSPVLVLLVATLLGPKHVSAEKLAPFECGSEPIGSPRVRFSVKFYQVAILFLVFDIESAFLYPWAVLFRKLSCTGDVINQVCTGATTWFGFGEMLAFLVVLGVALAYTWRKKAIGWG